MQQDNEKVEHQESKKKRSRRMQTTPWLVLEIEEKGVLVWFTSFRKMTTGGVCTLNLIE